MKLFRQWQHGVPRIVLLIIIASLVISACTGGDGEDGIDLFGQEPTQLDSESAQQVATTFLDAWKENDFETMYSLISPNARDAFSQETFIGVYEDIDTDLSIESIDWTINGTLVQGTTAVVDYNVTFNTQLLGEFTDPNELQTDPRLMRLVTTPEGWRLAWSRNDVFAGWTNNSTLEIVRTSPTRGNIYDRNGQILVDQNGTSVQLYVRQDQMPSIDGCINTLARILRIEYDEIESTFIGYNTDTVFLVGEVSQETAATEQSALSADCGMDSEDAIPRQTRQYYERVAPHLIGYVGQIPAERRAEYEARGYPPDALVGLEGIEQAFENQLAGTIGLRLVVRSNTGVRLRVIAERPAEPGESIYLTIDRDLQLDVQALIADAYSNAGPTWAPTSPGASAVVMDVNTGEILAMASYPDYDPSVFNPDTPIFNPQEQIAEYNTDLRRPLLNRSTQGRYPLGSVFKIFSMVAGLDSGEWLPTSTVTCTGVWNGEAYGDRTRTDWFAEGHGPLNMELGLTASCNPYFWTLGVTLNQADPDLLSSYADLFGFDSAPPFQGIATDAGNIPDPEWKSQQSGDTLWTNSDAANLVIGQGQMQVNPLQVVRGIAVVANGGTLYDPLIVKRVQLLGEEPSEVFSPSGETLPIDPNVLRQTRDAMCNVTSDPTYGTAYYMFGEEWYDEIGYAIEICGKTGTAEAGNNPPHAWFGSFAPADNPEIAIIVIVENSCEGSEVAAPITRRIIERYYGLYEGYGWPQFWQGACVDLTPGAAGP